MNTFTFRLFGLLMGVLLIMGSTNSSFAQCVVDSLVPSVPGIYPDSLADAVGCEYYEEDITFFLPRDTTVDVFGNLLTVPFNSFTIDSLVGLPPGLSWACNLAPACLYDVSPGAANPDTLGCIQVSGTPLEPGYYAVVVHLTANADILGNPTDQPATYQTDIIVSPCAFVGDCYTSQLSDICAGAELSMTNNIPSNGDSRYSYLWNLTNNAGFNFQTTNENPAIQTLSDPGTYLLSYDAVIDTFPYTLTGATIDSIGCGDILDAADIYWKLFDLQGNELVNTSGSPLNNSGNNLPIITGIGPFVLDTGTYEFQVWDNDDLTQDDGCATGGNGSGASIFFTIPSPSGNITITNDALRVIFTIDHPIQTVSCTDTFQIDSLPMIPEIMNMADTNLLCLGDSLTLMAINADSVQWFLDGQELNGESGLTLMVYEPGVYSLESIDLQTACRRNSATFEILLQQIPIPSIAYDGSSSLSIAAPNSAYRYDWYDIDDGFIGSGTSISPSSSGNFFALAVDTLTGCQSDSSVVIQAILTSIEHLGDVLNGFHLYPNPSQGEIWLELSLREPQNVAIRILDLSGRVVWNQSYGRQAQSFRHPLALGALARGIYLVQVRLDAGTIHQKLVLR